ncbi:molybdenum cofactor biosynthesis protein MoaE [Formicincola oecophyllae]|uniref:Molybdopterin synthase catalytic subunit n=1 Tax=Formicincola oecophyllae TaxID=2558361 RepID=A0A4Y6UBU8_9PROT|nr:molybdenum cofactor biosynthesis protein MoaE [Formicincola oecophyllae]
MRHFMIAHADVDVAALREKLQARSAGGFCTFEGWVRDHNEGADVTALDYEVYEALAQKEGEAILAEACARFPVTGVAAMHRDGTLAVGGMAVWVGAAAAHREAAFDACRYVIDEIKARLPVWKREHYVNAPPQWVACHHRGQHAPQAQGGAVVGETGAHSQTCRGHDHA